MFRCCKKGQDTATALFASASLPYNSWSVETLARFLYTSTLWRHFHSTSYQIWRQCVTNSKCDYFGDLTDKRNAKRELSISNVTCPVILFRLCNSEHRKVFIRSRIDKLKRRWYIWGWRWRRYVLWNFCSYSPIRLCGIVANRPSDSQKKSFFHENLRFITVLTIRY